MPIQAPPQITGLILAGGLGRRMGGNDKGLVLLDDKPLVVHVMERLAPQVDSLMINANRNEAAYRAFGHPVLGDQMDGFIGPLAGVHAGLKACTTPMLVTAACDSPFLPTDLVARLRDGLMAVDALVSVPRTIDGLQPTFALMRRDALASLEAFLSTGGRSIQAWLHQQPLAVIDFPDAAAFANINTPEELAASRHD
jgi:molybdenum cofactor guanylyltransferase